MENSENELISQILRRVGEDPSRDGLRATPERYWRALRFMTSGYDADVKSTVEKALFEEKYDDMVIVKNIEFYSLCEHHMLPFYGRCHIGYIPDGKIVGLSKIPRIVDVFSRRLQVQERLTDQLCNTLQEFLQPKGVGIVVNAYHLCMMMRGVQKQNSYTVTSSMNGCFRKIETREEFLAHVRSEHL